jgi:hypothetical protein
MAMQSLDRAWAFPVVESWAIARQNAARNLNGIGGSPEVEGQDR